MRISTHRSGQVLAEREAQVQADSSLQVVLTRLTVHLPLLVGTLLMTPVYTSETTLLIQEKLPQLVDFRQAVSEAIGTEKHDYYLTQAGILRSPSLAAQVIQEQRLDGNKIFTGHATKPWTILTEWVETQTPAKAILPWVKGVFSSGKAEVSDPTATLRKLADTYIKDYLEIKPVDKTHLVLILLCQPRWPTPTLAPLLTKVFSCAPGPTPRRSTFSTRTLRSKRSKGTLLTQWTSVSQRTEIYRRLNGRLRTLSS